METKKNPEQAVAIPQKAQALVPFPEIQSIAQAFTESKLFPGIVPRHIGKVLFAEELAKWMFEPTAPDTWWRIVEGVPLDAEYRGHAFDCERNCFIFYFEHPSFPPINEDGKIVYKIPVHIKTKFIPDNKKEGLGQLANGIHQVVEDLGVHFVIKEKEG